MAHYAFLDAESLVVAVIVGRDEGDDGVNWEQYYGERLGMTCRRTSYNTFAGVHHQGKQPFRKNYAGIGYTYDAERDAFIPPQIFPSWVLNESSCQWQAPVPKPPEDHTVAYEWDEASVSWVAVELEPLAP